MPLSINTNIASMTAQRSFINSNASLEQAFERLSTGKRVNSAVDDAAGLAIAKDLESRVSGLNQAIRNVNDGISMVQIAEGTLDEATTILQRMRDLAVQASNGSLSSTERGYLDAEHAKLAATLDSVLNQAKFDDVDLIGSSTTSITIQSGADATDTTAIAIDAVSASGMNVQGSRINLAGMQEIYTFTAATDALVDAEVSHGSTAFTVTIGSAAAVAVTVADGDPATLAELVTGLNNATTGLTFSESGDGTLKVTGDDAGTVLDAITISFGGTSQSFSGVKTTSAFGLTEIDAALATIASDRATLGATQSQLESTVRNLANVAENTAAATGRIMDTDYAAETANLTKAQILQQAATSILAQANAQPQAVLSLLQ
jgi:flagellin